VLVFGVGRGGLPSSTFVRTDLDNDGPFGFSFDRRGNLLTTLFVGAPDGSSVGSFRINADNSLTAITRNLPNGQIDSCWIENNGRFAYSANYGSGTISSYRIGRDGSLTLLNATAGSTDDLPNPTVAPTQGATPLDMRISRDGRSLYNVLPGSGAVGVWQINRDGSLTKVGEFGGLPQSVNGDHAPVEFGPGGSPAGIEVL
jgi:6-phosphogluconolactonase (cycloisomerase 2 family)